MDVIQIMVPSIVAVVTAAISYLAARHQGKIDLQKASESNKNEIEKLIKQHEVNLESLQEQHKMQMEAKEQEQKYKIELMQKEYELEIHKHQQSKTNDVMTNAMGSFINNIVSDPSSAMDKMLGLQNLAEGLKGFGSAPGGNK